MLLHFGHVIAHTLQLHGCTHQVEMMQTRDADARQPPSLTEGTGASPRAAYLQIRSSILLNYVVIAKFFVQSYSFLPDFDYFCAEN